MSDAEVAELKQHAMDLYDGKVVHDMDGLGPSHHPGEQRLHQLHRVDATMERFLLHPRVVDVVEALTGPDVLALQTMQFFNAPQPAGEPEAAGGNGGQGWHQDSKYIATYPDTLIGTWLALDTADEENGCLWVVSDPCNMRSIAAPSAADAGAEVYLIADVSTGPRFEQSADLSGAGQHRQRPRHGLLRRRGGRRHVQPGRQRQHALPRRARIRRAELGCRPRRSG